MTNRRKFGVRLAIVNLMLLCLAAAGLAMATPSSTEANPAVANITIVMKNSALPLKKQIGLASCSVHRCIEI
jgi:hypothetical protein